MPFPKINLQKISKLGNYIFLETGTYKGDGIEIAIKNNFKKIISIEAVKEYYEHSKVRFKEFIDTGRVEIYLGGSEKLLSVILNKYNKENFFYWLDAHKHGITNGDVAKCPLQEEINYIIKRNNSNDIICIDDLRLLKTTKWGEIGLDWSKIQDQISENFRENITLNLDGHTFNDVFLSINKKNLMYLEFDTFTSNINTSLKLIIKSHPLIFDVGANTGQSINRFNRMFEQPFIHSFEPDPLCFGQLENKFKNSKNIKLNNFALGSKKENKIFNLNFNSQTNSFHDWYTSTNKTEKKILVPIITLQDYIDQNNIKEIDLIKIDTQGFEEEILSGLIDKTIVKNFLIEIIFIDYYTKKTSFYNIEKLLGTNFRLCSLQQTYNQKNGMIKWADALYTKK